jgi:hypothetical protein
MPIARPHEPVPVDDERRRTSKSAAKSGRRRTRLGRSDCFHGGFDDQPGALLLGDGADRHDASSGGPGRNRQERPKALVIQGSRGGRAWALGESLLPGTALAFLLIEHGWAQPLFDAIPETRGALLGEGFLTSQTGLLVGAEVAAMEEAAQVIAAAQAAEAHATLLAMAAETQRARSRTMCQTPWHTIRWTALSVAARLSAPTPASRSRAPVTCLRFHCVSVPTTSPP